MKILEGFNKSGTLTFRLQTKLHSTFQARSDSPLLTIKDAPEKRLIMRKVLANYSKKPIFSLVYDHFSLPSEEKTNPGVYCKSQANNTLTP